MINSQSELLQSYISKINKTPANNKIAANLPVDFQPEKLPTNKEKKKKIAKIALISAIAMTLAAGTFASIRYRGEIIKGKDKFVQKAKETGENLSEYENGANNITNIKDALTRKFLYKIPFYEKFDNFTSNIYRKSILKTITKSHAKAKNTLFASDKKLAEAIKSSKIGEDNIQKALELISKREKFVEEFANSENVSKRFFSLDKSMERLDIDGIKRLKGVKKETVQDLATESIGESRLQTSKKLQLSLIEKYSSMGLSPKETEELTSIVELLGDNSLTKDFQKAEKLFQKSYSRESNDLFAKLRDINFGSAPTDIMGILSTTALLGLYTAQADTKEERVKVSLTTGIPLLTTLGTTLFATVKMVSGFKAMGLGLLTGFAAKTAGGIINKEYQKRHNIKETPKTIITLDDYMDKAKNLKNKFIQ